MKHTDQSRSEFEEHVLAPNGIYENGVGWVERNADGTYRRANIQERWITWQASRELRNPEIPAPSAPIVEELRNSENRCAEEYSGVELPDPVAWRRRCWSEEWIYEDGITSFRHDPSAERLYTEQQVRKLLAGVKDSLTGGWIPVSDRLPEPGKPVLLDIGKKFPIRAMWVTKLMLKAGTDDPDGFGEYSAEHDAYFCPEGWYEWNEHEDTNWFVTATPISWLHMPQPIKEQDT